MNNYPFQQHYEAFKTLIETFEASGIHHYLIGGQARDLLLSQKDIKPISVTPDIDFAVMVQDFGQFEGLRTALFGAGFERTKLPYRLLWPSSRTMIDLLPFGEIAADDVVHFPPPGFDISVLGFHEIGSHLERYYIDEGRTLSIPIAPLHGIFLLKVISWDDRPEIRGKDLKDLKQILAHYWTFYQEEAYDDHLDIFDLEIEPLEGWGARILGRHLAAPLSKSIALKQRVVDILVKQVVMVDPPGPMLLCFALENEDGDRSIVYAIGLLQQVLLGIEDGCKPKPPSVELILLD
jgi:predicted nucleotidyltransferase